MPLATYPVSVVYRLTDDPDQAPHSLGVQAVATADKSAMAVAVVLVRTLARLRHPGRTAEVLLDRLKAGAPGAVVDGLYAYVLSRHGHVNHLVFPGRIEQDLGQAVSDTLRGLDEQQTFGVLADAVYLSYINSMGLASLAAHAQRLNMHVFRAQPAIAKVVAMTGLSTLVTMHPDLNSALAALEATAQSRLPPWRS